MSFLVWVFVKLERNYSANSEIDIVLQAPAGLIMNKDRLTNVPISCSGTGFNILSFSWSKKEPIHIKLPQRFGKFSVDNDLLNKLIADQTDFEFQIEVNSIGRIETFLDSLVRVKKPVLSRLRVHPEYGYIIIKPISFKPDSVWVEGPKIVLDTMLFISTSDTLITDLRKNKIAKVSIESEYTVSPKTVEFQVEIGQLTEREITIPIAGFYQKAIISDSLIFLPDSLSLTLSLPIELYDTPLREIIDLKIQSDMDSLRINNKSAVSIIPKSELIEIVKINPDSVEVFEFELD